MIRMPLLFVAGEPLVEKEKCDMHLSAMTELAPKMKQAAKSFMLYNEISNLVLGGCLFVPARLNPNSGLGRAQFCNRKLWFFHASGSEQDDLADSLYV